MLSQEETQEALEKLLRALAKALLVSLPFYVYAYITNVAQLANINMRGLGHSFHLNAKCIY